LYLRPVFTETDPERIDALIRAHSFGLLVTHGGTGSEATHLPFVLSRDGGELLLEAHLAAANPQCAALAGGAALAVFSGPHAYISPRWYEAQPSVPTWDYVAVHVHGVLQPVTEPGEMRAMLDRLAEADPVGYTTADQSDSYIAGMLRGIRAFRLRTTQVQAQWKMSQNRSAEDRIRVAAALRGQGEETVADLIAATLPQAEGWPQ